jgi:hypothetical protein
VVGSSESEGDGVKEGAGEGVSKGTEVIDTPLLPVQAESSNKAAIINIESFVLFIVKPYSITFLFLQYRKGKRRCQETGREKTVVKKENNENCRIKQ